MLDNYVVIMAGLLLIIPGLISDVIAPLLLIPPLRRWLIRRAAVIGAGALPNCALAPGRCRTAEGGRGQVL
jgi:UPF0716 family protein affecting phage T7 exclusion